MNSPLVCPSCGTSARADETICRECDALLRPAQPSPADLDPAPPAAPSRATSPSGMAPRTRMDAAQADDVTPTVVDRLACWSCRLENPPSRSFCEGCGAWLSRRADQRRSPVIIGDTIAGSSPGVRPASERPQDRRSLRRSRTALVASVLAVATLGILGLAFAGSLVGDDAGGDVAGLVPADEVVDDATTVEEAAAASGLPEAPVIEVTSVVGADGVEIDFDGAIDSRPVQASEVSLDALDTATEADGSVELPTTAPTEGAPDPTLSATPVVDPKTDWICEGPVRIEDPRQRRWRVIQIRFVDRGGYESVVLDLQRTGGSDAATNATARSFPTADINDVIPRASQPGAGGTTVGVNLADGFAGVVDVDGYRPRGMDVVKEVSTYPSRGSAWVAISTAGDGCFRINSPAWRRSAATDTAILTIDVRR